MISLSTLRGWLGNQLFQYAFMRTAARRLGVRFYFPRWIGDEIFELDDYPERAASPDVAIYLYSEFDFDYKKTAPRDGGFKQSAVNIVDRTDIQGFFQTEKYLDRASVLSWYRFRKETVADIQDRYRHIDFSNSVGLHVRLGDFVTHFSDRFFVPGRDYYQRALTLVPSARTIVVFSDDPRGARTHLGDLADSMTFIEGGEPYEHLYLQTQCRNFICAPSTFSWWGAWLIDYPDKVVVAPKEGPYRPGAPDVNLDFWPPGWIKVDSLRPVLDHYLMVKAKVFPRRAARKLGRLWAAHRS